ncbi:hypothetical protein ColLi_01360 [Colletotrichum liriopes]|uniref:Uncharacterized protein n=1 Tax=Colletotrichum liriopes TaxID=708192 RepID=A0AA37LNV0_9PEZI|nr:hypothetical protein ColLi_01360 [Colletotrichum liriopes]
MSSPARIGTTYPTYRSKFGPKYVLDSFHDPTVHNAASERNFEALTRRTDAQPAGEYVMTRYNTVPNIGGWTVSQVFKL